MAATLSQIGGYLDRMNWRYDVDTERNRIVTGVKTTNMERLVLVIALEENGEFFKLYAPQVLQIRNHPHQAAALQTLLTIAWETKMVQWEYDPSDGEVRAIIEFPLEDAPLTERQFVRCLDALVRIVDEKAYPRLQQTLETGQDPGDITDDERFLLEFEQHLPGVAERIYRAVLRRKQRMQMQKPLDA
ncbi:MAG: hypothetical protein NZ821_02530 [Gloeomargarita sp. SKYB31]|nr:hypothetical protein [Gloeomargarita sp. SKYB31]